MGIKVLVIEDDDYKREHVRKFLTTAFPQFEVEFAESFQSGIRKAVGDRFALIILDMTLPTFDKGGLDAGGRLRHLGGRELFDQFRRRHVETRVIVLTGYDKLGEGDGAVPREEVAKELAERFPDLFVTAIFYTRASDTWMSELKGAIGRVIREGEL